MKHRRSDAFLLGGNMITATIDPYGLLVEGHARAGPYGQDF